MCNREFASKQLNKILIRINLAAEKVGRDPSEITLVGACKQQSSNLVQAFIDSGLYDFGENYLQEFLTKQQKLTSEKVCWHFIGRVQSNKCKDIAQHFNWVHAVDRYKVAKALGKARPANLQPLNLLVQLNVENEDTKGGITAEQAYRLCDEVAELESVNLRGFMLIPKSDANLTEQRRPFATARETMERVNQRLGLKLDTLSMGMSNDLEAGILEGATMIRVGTALFGARDS